MFLFTLALAQRGSNLLVQHIERLRRVYAAVENRRPFETVAICILPDHIHALWQLPDGDADYALRWSLFKSGFSRGLPPRRRSISKIVKREKGIWQRRYWEHASRNDADFERHVDYTHCNPVKHGLVSAAPINFHPSPLHDDRGADLGAVVQIDDVVVGHADAA